VTTARATVIAAEPLESGEAGERWTAAAGDAEVQLAMRELSNAIALHRLAVADPFVRDPALSQALVVRVGHGAGEQVADGRWTQARELAPARPSRPRRAAALRPQERFAALLGGHEKALACEELTLRARQDIDAGRMREAALQLSVALAAAVAEIQGLPDRVAELKELRSGVEAAARAAVSGAPPEAASLEATLGRLEAALRARAAGE
jgi:hypothetical protein